MHKIQIKEIYNTINIIKSPQKPLITNFYFNKTNKLYKIKSTNNSLIFIYKDFGFYRIYFLGNDLFELEYLLNDLELDLDSYIEIIAKEAYLNLPNYKKEATYLKFYKKIDKNPNYIYKNDFILDYDMLYKNINKDFNKYYDHLPNKNTIKQYIKNNQVLYISKDDVLLSYLVFKQMGKSAYLNFIANYAGKDSIIKLWNSFYTTLNKINIQSINLWCNSSNKKAMNMYKIENFTFSELNNFIYSKSANIATRGGVEQSIKIQSIRHNLKAA